MKKEKFNFKKYLVANLGCKYSEHHDNRLDHDDNGYYIFIDDDRFMVFDLGDESGWIGSVPLDEDDPTIDYFKDILEDQDDSIDESNGILPF